MPRLPAVLRPLYPKLKPVYVRATGVVAPVAVALSRLGGSYLPTGVAHSMEEAAATSGGRCVVARPPETIVRPPFLGLPADLPPLEPATDTVVPRLAVAELPNGRILGPHRAVITGAGDLLWELSLYFGTTNPRQHPLFLSPFPGAPHEVKGRLGVLASRGDRNYYHFLIDVLPRLGVLAQAAEIDMPEQWYVPATSPFQLELLDLMGITADRRINSDEIGHVRAETLVVPGLASVVKEKNTPWMVEFLRQRLLPNVEPTERRPVYITRSAGTNNRAVTNEPELIALLTARGFDVVDPGALSVVDQIRIFASSSIIVSPHGAALANLVFASPGCHVIELFPPGCVLPDYWRLASSVPGVTYRYLSAWPPSDAPQNRPSAIVSDITVDLAALVALLDEVQ
jgi:capsular polysaccharide biosynthesis protein